MKKIGNLKIKAINTRHLKSIIEENYNRGINGRDYQGIIEELKNEYFQRMNKNAEKIINDLIKERENEK